MDSYTDNVFDALADTHRRRLLFALLETNSLSGTAVYLDSPPDGRPVERDRTRHQHVHLPKLDDYGYIEWTHEENEVERGARFSEIEPILELLYDHRHKLVRA